MFLDDYQLPGAVVRLPSSGPTSAAAVEEISTAKEHHHWAATRTGTRPGTQPSDYSGGS